MTTRKHLWMVLISTLTLLAAPAAAQSAYEREAKDRAEIES
jgi:hypothetical protein